MRNAEDGLRAGTRDSTKTERPGRGGKFAGKILGQRGSTHRGVSHQSSLKPSDLTWRESAKENEKRRTGEPGKTAAKRSKERKRER